MNALDAVLRVAVGLFAVALVAVLWMGPFVWGMAASENTGDGRYMVFGLLCLFVPPVIGLAYGLGTMILGG